MHPKTMKTTISRRRFTAGLVAGGMTGPALAACTVALPAGNSRAPRSPPAPVTVQLTWTHQAQFAGWYAADRQGYYAAEGLVPAFLEGGPQVDYPAVVSTGRAQFAVVNPAALLTWRADGQPLRAIAVIYRRNPTVYMTLASSGIARPEDFAGKTIHSSAGGVAMLAAVTARVGVQPDQYTVVNAGTDLSRFYSGEVHVRSVFVMNEPLEARQAGYKINLIYPDDYGVHGYGDCIATTDDLTARDPDLVRRLLRATLKGWTYAVEHPAAAAALVAKYRPNADLAHESAFLAASLPLINTGEDHIGWMKPDVWAGMERTLRQYGGLTRPLDLTQVYTTRFLDELYGPARAAGPRK